MAYAFCKRDGLAVVHARWNADPFDGSLRHDTGGFALEARVLDDQPDSLAALAFQMHHDSAPAVDGRAGSSAGQAARGSSARLALVAAAGWASGLPLEADLSVRKSLPMVLPLMASTKSMATSLVMLSPLRFLAEPEVKVSW